MYGADQPQDVIRVATLADKQASVHLYVETFCRERLQQKQIAKLYQALWDWKFVRNPDSFFDNPTLWIYQRGEKVIGQRGMLPFILLVRDEAIRGSWGVDFAVHPGYQRQGIGRKLLGHWFSKGEICAALGSTPRSVRLYEKLGLRQIKPVYQMIKPIMPLKAIGSVSGWRRKLVLLRGAAIAPIRARGSRSRGRIEVTQEYPDERWRESLSRMCGEYEFISRRTVERLRWQFVEHPFYGYEFLVAKRSYRIVGYAVVRRGRGYGGLKSAVIADLLFPPNEPGVGLELIQHIVAMADREGLAAVIARASHETVCDVFRQTGFFPRPTPVTFFIHLSDAIASAFLPHIAEAKRWHITLADSDAEAIPPIMV